MKLYLDWNLGLGDAIICNGLVRELSKVNESIILPCYGYNLNTISHMFSDLSNIEYIDIDKSEYEGGNKLCIGCDNSRFESFSSFDLAFYELANVPFEKRWDSFHITMKETMEIPYDKEGFILIHEDKNRGFNIESSLLSHHKNEDLFILKKFHSLNDICHLMMKAKEIHCINSSMLHLAESLHTKADLYFHQYARPFTKFHIPVLKKNWNILL